MKRGTRRLLLVLSAVLFLQAATLLTEAVRAASEEERKLSITVVEEIPAMDIEDGAVPLAAFPGGDSGDGVRHAVLMGITLAAVIGYIWYFSRYEKWLSDLRRRAARAQLLRMRELRDGHVEAGDER